MDQGDTLWEGKVIKVPVNKIMTQGWGVAMPLSQDNEDVLLALQAESKLLLVDFMDKDGEKGICQINGYILDTKEYVNWLKK